MTSKLIMMTAVALAVGGCHRADVDHPKTDYTSSLLSRMTPGQIDAATVPLAPAQRGPIAANANTADLATDASLAFSNGANAKAAPVPDTSPDGQHAAVLAEELAAQAPDTATGDEIKRKIYEDYAARSFASANANGSATKGSTVNTSSKEPVAQSKASSSSEPVAAQSNAANGNAPMPTENAPRPAS
jgi:hypothetical protein